LSSAHQTDLTPKKISGTEPFSLADTHQHFRVPVASIVRVMESAGSSQTMLHIYRLTVAGLRRQSNIIITTLRTSDLILNDTQVREISAKI